MFGDILIDFFNQNKKKSTRFATTALKFIFTYLVIFSVAQYISFIITGVEQSYLIESTFTVFGVELGGLLLKRMCDKAFNKKNSNNNVGNAESNNAINYIDNSSEEIAG